MRYLEPYVLYKSISFHDVKNVIKMFEQLQAETTDKEGFIGLETNSSGLCINYYRVSSAVEFIFDEIHEKVIHEQVQKVIKAEIKVSFDEKTLVIWGRPNIFKRILNKLIGSEGLLLKDMQLNYLNLVGCLRGLSYEIRNLAFSNLKIHGSHVNTASFDITNNNDAHNIISNVKAKLTSVNFRIFFDSNESVDLKFNLEDALLKIEYDTLAASHLEWLKDFIDQLNFRSETSV